MMSSGTSVKVSLRWILGALLCFAVAHPVRADDVRERLNKIFYWHLSDDLKLSPKQEKEMVTIIEDIQKRRQSSLDARDADLESLRKIGKTPAAAGTTGAASAADKILSHFKETLVRLGGLDVEEHDRLKTLFGSETLARYYVVREEVMSRVRDALKNAEQQKR